MQKLTVYKDNDVVNASYRLTLGETRLILACIGKIKSIEAIDKQSNYFLEVSEYSKLFSITEKSAYFELKNASKKMFDRKVIIDIQNLSDAMRERLSIENGKLETRWISHIAYSSDKKGISIGFSEILLPYLSQLGKNYTKYKLEYVANFNSAYAVRIYELLAEKQFLNCTREISIADLREKLQLDDKHQVYGNLNNRVIKPAVEQINKHSNMDVTYEPIKNVRSVIGVRFAYTFKDGKDPHRDSSKNQNLIATANEVNQKAKPGETYAIAKTRILKEKKPTKKTLAIDNIKKETTTKSRNKGAFDEFKSNLIVR